MGYGNVCNAFHGHNINKGNECMGVLSVTIIKWQQVPVVMKSSEAGIAR